MATNDHWIHQGRQEHGWFGHGSGPGDDPGQETRDAGSGGLFVRHSVGERIDYVAHSVVGHLARSDRWHVAAAFDGRALDRLRTVAVVWAGAAGLSRDEFRERLLDPGTGDATVDRLRRAARGMVAARGHEALAEAGKDLSDAARQIGLERWPRFVADAETRAMAAVSRGDAPGVLKASAITGEVAGGMRVGGLVLTYLLHRFGPSGARTSPPVLAGPPPSPDASIMYADVPLPPPREGETTADVLKPNGRLVGRPGRGNGVRELPGGQAAAQELYDRLTKGGRDITPPRFPGKKIELPNGDRIGYRPSSTSGPPTLDIEVKGVSSEKIKFLEK